MPQKGIEAVKAARFKAVVGSRNETARSDSSDDEIRAVCKQRMKRALQWSKALEPHSPMLWARASGFNRRRGTARPPTIYAGGFEAYL